MIYLYEDNPDFRTELQDYLAGLGFPVHCGSSVHEVSECLRRQDTLTEDDVILLDLTLDGGSAFEFIPQFSRTVASCIVLTGNPGETERVIGLELGADDYISKTVTPREIAARIKTVMRRRARSERVEHTTDPQRGWRVDKVRCAVHSPSGERIELTVAEFGLLTRLIDAGGSPVSREELTPLILRRAYHPADRSLDNLVARIRNKFRSTIGDAPIIKAARHMGYIFVGFPEAETGSTREKAIATNAPAFVDGAAPPPVAQGL